MQISKSRYCRGIQCPKMVWIDLNKPEEAVSTVNEAVLETGTQVGILAQSIFPDCQVVPFSLNGHEMAEETHKLLEAGANTVAEASFYYEDLFCSVDILHRSEDSEGYDIVEVKSSTGISEIYLEDVAFQYYVLTGAGLKINHAYILHINSTYVRHGELELGKLFHLEDCTEYALELQEKIPARLQAIRLAMKMKEEPQWGIDTYCEKPYECAYKGYCGRHLPSPSVFDISNMTYGKKYALYHRGGVSFGDILGDENLKVQLTKNHLRQVETEAYHLPDTVNKEEIREFLKGLKYPLYFLDFETYQQAIPQFDGVRPYMQIPFQYSLHVQQVVGGELEHFEYLGQAGEDPRRGLAEQLVRDIPRDACILAYNMGFEKGRIKDMAELYPDLSYHLMNIYDHVIDLMEPFQKKHYYSEKLHGSYSIKYVLPALCPDDPELNYQNLSGVHNGGEAMNAFARLASMTPEEAEETRRSLLAYCRLDTLAMVKILEKLWEMSEV